MISVPFAAHTLVLLPFFSFGSQISQGKQSGKLGPWKIDGGGLEVAKEGGLTKRQYTGMKS